MDRYVVGQIIKPHGVRGAMKIDPLTDDILRFKNLKKVYLDGTVYKVQSVQFNKREVILKLDNISTMNEAESFRNKQIFVDKQDAVKLEEGRYFIVDIINCAVFVDDEPIGILKDVLQYGSADVYVINLNNNKQAMVPALKKLILNVDILNKKIILDKKTFEEVVVYED